MLPTLHQIMFAFFALCVGLVGLVGLAQVYRNIRGAKAARELRFNNPLSRVAYALSTTLSQSRVFKKRLWVSDLHAFIMYGFVFYLLVNAVDALEGYAHFEILSDNFFGATYNFLADMLSLGVLIGVLGLMYRRFFSAAKKDFSFNARTLLHEQVKESYINKDSLFVSYFILFHVSSRIVGQGYKLILQNHYPEPFQPVASAVAGILASLGVTPETALSGYAFGYWGALGSILLFLSYFPYSKHIHLFLAPINYALKRNESSGTLPLVKVDLEAENPELGGAKVLSDLEYPRLIDAYACIQCNRCQDVCPASSTGKALSPAALVINKRMELNGAGIASQRPLLEFAINPEAVWACTTCGACMEVCPTQNEQYLDIIDIRRDLVMVEGDFPKELSTAFRGMERSGNPWGISADKRMDWAEGLNVPTVAENPNPDVLYWVGCAASYDPSAQKVSRSFVQLLGMAGINFAVLGKKESCTGDSARRAGNEMLFQELANKNIGTLNAVNPKLVVATCPHCMNTLKHEYPQLGGNYDVVHHTEYLERLLVLGKLSPSTLDGSITYHDPCYLGRHNGVYAAPRDLIRSMGQEILELERNKENSFCCGAGGAQFWKEEEEGDIRINEARFQEIQARLDNAKAGKTVAVGCPFCKTMLNASPSKGNTDIEVKDIAELLLESSGGSSSMPEIKAKETVNIPQVTAKKPETSDKISTPPENNTVEHPHPAPVESSAPRKKWGKASSEQQPTAETIPQAVESLTPPPPETARKKWGKTSPQTPAEATTTEIAQHTTAPARKKWGKASSEQETPPTAQPEAEPEKTPPARKKWSGNKANPSEITPPVTQAPTETPEAEPSTGRKKWQPKK